MTKILYIPTGQFILFRIEEDGGLTILWEESGVCSRYSNFFDFLSNGVFSHDFLKRNKIYIGDAECFEIIKDD